MRDVSISNIAFGKTMTHGNLVLNANNRGLEVGGNARLDNMPVKLKWRENFDSDVIYQTQYALSGRLSAERWGELFNLDVRGFEADHLSGDLKFDVTVDVKTNGDGVINAAIDLKETRISLPKFGWAKSKKVEAKAQLSGNITASGINQIPFVEVIGGGMTLIGDVEFQALHKRIKPQQGESRWMEIAWYPSVWEARKRAASEGKPIFLMVNMEMTFVSRKSLMI